MLRRTNRAPQGAVIRNAESNHETQRIARTVACSEQDWDCHLFLLVAGKRCAEQDWDRPRYDTSFRYSVPVSILPIGRYNRQLYYDSHDR